MSSSTTKKRKRSSNGSGNIDLSKIGDEALSILLLALPSDQKKIALCLTNKNTYRLCKTGLRTKTIFDAAVRRTPLSTLKWVKTVGKMIDKLSAQKFDTSLFEGNSNALYTTFESQNLPNCYTLTIPTKILDVPLFSQKQVKAAERIVKHVEQYFDAAFKMEEIVQPKHESMIEKIGKQIV